LQVVKRSGQREDYDPRKTIAAVIRSGVPEDEAEGIVRALEAHLYDGITTEEIYRRVHQMLQGRKAARYSLKKALLRLGPEGENFEYYVARLFQAEGYRTRTRLILNGHCTSHEVDVLMDKGEERVMVECKFHNSLGIKSNIQCALYVYARFLDLRESEDLDRPALVTNTRFSLDATRYAECMGMDLLGWRTPEESGIETLAKRHRLFPITSLEMRRSDQATLLAHRFIVVDDVLARTKDVRQLLPPDSADQIMAQAKDFLSF
jgi:hypothetical protein